MNLAFFAGGLLRFGGLEGDLLMEELLRSTGFTWDAFDFNGDDGGSLVESESRGDGTQGDASFGNSLQIPTAASKRRSSVCALFDGEDS